MSSKGPLASKFSFSALEVEGGDESHSESDGELVEVLSPAPPPPAKARPPPTAEKSKTKASKTKGKLTPNQRSPSNPSAIKEAVGVTASAPALADDKTQTPITPRSNLGSPTPEPIPTSSIASTLASPRLTTPPVSPKGASSPAMPSTRFQPTLPDLQAPPASTGLRPQDRKRKASHDLVASPLHKESKIQEDQVEKPRPVGSSPKIVGLPPAELDVNAERAKRKQNAITRTIWTLIMIGGFIAIVLLGHPYVVVLVFACQTLAYREVTALFTLTHPQKEHERGRSNAWDSTLNWYFFAVTNYFLYGESIIYYFKHIIFSDAQFLPFATNHRFISFMLYTIGFVGFVGSLKKQYLKHQFGLFGWVHMSLLVLVVSSHFIVNNILEGLIWFWVPASLVICNDIWAYICGVTFGRTPLIKLSPKKTVEGFVGAFICTLIFAVLWGSLFQRYDYMICPVRDLGTHAFSDNHCTPNSVFIWRHFELWRPLNAFLSSILALDHPIPPIPYTTYQLHCLVLATFASLVAPFGGFFASGFKRAFNLKDFGDSIPGHGGMTDRMDCQFLMGMFSYVYYSALVREHHVTVGSVLQTIVSNLNVEEQVELFVDLKRYLDGIGAAIPA